MKHYDPYAKGRNYRFFIESDGSVYKLTNSDIDGVTISGTRLKFPAGFHVIDTIYDINAIAGGDAAGVQHSTYIYNDGTQAINLPGKDLFDHMYVTVFGYFA